MGEPHLQHSRSAPQLKALPLAEDDADSRANLSELLARLISSRKGVCVCERMHMCICVRFLVPLCYQLPCVLLSSSLHLRNLEG